jgi:hypothetical protein
MTDAALRKVSQAHIRYKLPSGEIVPGTTTITSLRAKPPLLRWNNQMGLQGIDTTKYVDKTAAIGTLCHAMVESYLSKQRLDLSEYSPADVKRARQAFRKFIDWSKGKQIEPILLEEPLVSELHRFGGTIDVYAKVDGVLTLIDLKTSKAIYDEHKAQVTAYARLLQENEYVVEDVRILRIGRNPDEGFEDVKVSNLTLRWRWFKCLLAAYRIEKKLK